MERSRLSRRPRLSRGRRDPRSRFSYICLPTNVGETAPPTNNNEKAALRRLSEFKHLRPRRSAHGSDWSPAPARGDEPEARKPKSEHRPGGKLWGRGWIRHADCVIRAAVWVSGRVLVRQHHAVASRAEREKIEREAPAGLDRYSWKIDIGSRRRTAVSIDLLVIAGVTGQSRYGVYRAPNINRPAGAINRSDRRRASNEPEIKRARYPRAGKTQVEQIGHRGARRRRTNKRRRARNGARN